tara:strand:- start:417 stop:641 length:225 start_codon:yes stop_codon:yes gene_type:complete
MNEEEMKEYEVQVWHDEDEEGYLGEIHDLYLFDDLKEAKARFLSITDFYHKILMHYPDYDKSEDGGDGDVILQE